MKTYALSLLIPVILVVQPQFDFVFYLSFGISCLLSTYFYSRPIFDKRKKVDSLEETTCFMSFLLHCIFLFSLLF